MRILIDASCLIKEHTGIAMYTSRIIQYMIPLLETDELALFMSALKSPTPVLPYSSDHLTLIRRYLPGKLLLEIWKRFQWPAIELLARGGPFHLFHSPNFLYQASRVRRIITTIHDLSFFKNRQYGSRYAGRYHRDMIVKNLHRISHIIAPSRYTQDQIVHYLGVRPENITVINNGIEPVTGNDSVCRVELPAGLDKRYLHCFIIAVGTLEPRKNMTRIVEAFDRVADHHKDLGLIIVGRNAEDTPNIQRKIAEIRNGSRVFLAGYITRNQLDLLYRKARAAVFSSWDEGFGFGPLEAAAYGLPVILSRIPVHEEIMGHTGVYFEHTDTQALADSIRKVLEDEDLQTDLRKKGIHLATQYDWNRSARLHLDLYRRIGQE